ncbi:NAD(P)-binding protein, partial [Aureobasidium melanogenum]
MAFFASIKRATKLVLKQNDRLDILMNNAGLAGIPPGMTADALASTLATAKQANSDVRIIHLSSELFKQAPKQGIRLTTPRTPMQETRSITRYAQSKRGNYFFTKVCAQKYPAVKSVVVHPGTVNTGIWDSMFKKSYFGWLVFILSTPFLTDVYNGAKRQLWASTANNLEVKNGAFYTLKGSQYTQAILKNDKLANELWVWTEKEFAKHGF